MRSSRWLNTEMTYWRRLASGSIICGEKTAGPRRFYDIRQQLWRAERLANAIGMPHPHRAASVGANHPRPVRAERHRIHPTLMTAE
jgi:hypothetical protein